MPDTLVAFPGQLLRCFVGGVRHLATRHWPVGASVVNKSGVLTPLSTADMDPVMHWIWNGLAPALGLPANRSRWFDANNDPACIASHEDDKQLATANVSRSARLLGYLVPHAGFDSNPCRDRCMFNPAYDLLPRDEWAIDSQMCRGPSDFAFDESTLSVCCPSLSYCCPHSIESCAHPRAKLLDVATLTAPQETLEKAMATGWYWHFAGRGWAACPVTAAWNNWTVVTPEAPWRRRCASAVTDSSLRTLIRVWHQYLGARAIKAYWIPPEMNESFWREA